METGLSGVDRVEFLKVVRSLVERVTSLQYAAMDIVADISTTRMSSEAQLLMRFHANLEVASRELVNSARVLYVEGGHNGDRDVTGMHNTDSNSRTHDA